MPTLPDSRALGQRVVPQSRRGIIQDRSGEIMARAVQQAGAVAQDTLDYVDQRKDRFNYATAKSGILQADIEARKELENDPDWATHEARYRERMANEREKAASSIRDRRDRALFEQDAAMDIERGSFDVRRAARGKEVDWGRATLEDNLAKNQQAAWKAPDEASRTAIIGASEDLISGATDKGYLPKEEAGSVRRKYASEYARGAIDMLPTDAAIVALTNPKKGSPGALLDEPVRVAMLEQLTKEQKREKEAADNHAMIMESRRDAAIQRAQRNAADQAWQHVAAGGTVATVPKTVWRGMDGRDQIAMQDREKAQARGSKVETDWNTYYALRTLATADPKEFQATDLRRYRSKLDDAEFKQLVDRQASGSPDGPDLDAMSEDKQISLAVDDVKLDDKKGAGLFERAIRADIGAEQKRVGRKLTTEERQKVIDRQLIDGEVVQPGAWHDPDKKRYQTFGTPEAQYFVPEGYDAIPKEERKKIEAALDRAGRPVTPSSVFDLWNSKR